jgi:ribonuclease HI
MCIPAVRTGEQWIFPNFSGMFRMKHVTIHTDGSCLGNPGPGGWGAVLRFNAHSRELAGGFGRTTNNRMELTAAIQGLETLTEPCQVDMYTDSRYLCDAIERRWLDGWKRNGWKTSGRKPVKNRDLWERLDMQLQRHGVRFCWVRGHAGDCDNERCDLLARTQAAQAGLPEDPGMDDEG